MSKVSINYSGGTLIFTALLCLCKVTGVLNISWWWCFCLFWLPFAVLFALLGLVVILMTPFLIWFLISEIRKK
jgi:hypothetical protein